MEFKNNPQYSRVMFSKIKSLAMYFISRPWRIVLAGLFYILAINMSAGTMANDKIIAEFVEKHPEMKSACDTLIKENGYVTCEQLEKMKENVTNRKKS